MNASVKSKHTTWKGIITFLFKHVIFLSLLWCVLYYKKKDFWKSINIITSKHMFC